MVIRCRFLSQSPTVWRLSSYFGPEICECRQRQISQQIKVAYGWLESRRSIYQTSNSAKQLYETSSSVHRLTCIASTLGGVRSGSEQKWATWHSTTIFFGFFYSEKRDDCDLPFFIDGLVWCFAFDNRTPDRPSSCVWYSENNRERASRHSRLTLWLCPFQGIHQLTFSLILQRWSGTGTTSKIRDPVALKGTVLERNQWDTVSSFCFFLLVLLKAPEPDMAVVRHILQPKSATCHHILEPTFELLRSLNSKLAFYHSIIQGQSLYIGCDCAY